MTENDIRQTYIKTITGWYGKNEADGTFRVIVDLYNTIKPLPVQYMATYHDSWCAIAVSAAAWACGFTDIIFPECGCNRMVALYKKAGRWKDRSYTAKPGDLIFYSWGVNGSSDHVGVVVENNGGTLKVIEGNKNDRMDYRTIANTNKTIMGYGVPNYASKATAESTADFSPQQFLEVIHSAVVKDMKQTGILASLTAAQALLESGRGNSSLARMYNNLFGIKKSTDWTGKTVDLPTTEYRDGVPYTVIATWKVYNNWSESIADHSALFNKYDRYKNLRGLTDYKLACRYVREDGYATSPTYTDSLIKVIEMYKLYDWDKEAISGGGTTTDGYTVDGYVLHNVKLGDTGSEVRFIQQMLIANGYGVGKDADDGECGPMTMRAILLYQYDNGLGQAGRGTWEKLIQSVK